MATRATELNGNIFNGSNSAISFFSSVLILEGVRIFMGGCMLYFHGKQLRSCWDGHLT